MSDDRRWYSKLEKKKISKPGAFILNPASTSAFFSTMWEFQIE